MSATQREKGPAQTPPRPADLKYTFRLVDHMCRRCFGRIAMATNSGPSGGGNPLYLCTQCGTGSAMLGCESICWCGFEFKQAEYAPFMCVRIDKTDPALMRALAENGIGESTQLLVGVVNPHNLERYRRELEMQGK